jgi:UDP-N-acetylglucosamine acyltransferase
MGMIHPTAIIHPKAKVEASVQVGPYAVIDEGVEIGAGCVIGPHVYITGVTRVGQGNKFFAGCVIGEAPQDLKYSGEPTRVRIGDRNVFREHVTVHRSSRAEGETIVGSDNYLMQHSHVGHDSRVANHVILVSGALLGGHASVDDRALVSGNALVHQFVRVGTLSLMQGGAAISKDLPPFTVAREYNGICGLNMIGLRRAGFTPAERLELKQLYHALFREGVNVRAAAIAAAERFSGGPARTLLDFVRTSKRGVCADRGRTDEEEG